MTESPTEEPIRLQPKIYICILSHRAMNPFFVNSMFHMTEYMQRSGLRYQINSKTSISNIVNGRQQMVNEALDSACTHMMFVDDDMVFAMDLTHKMLHEMNKLTVEGHKKIAMGVNPCRKSPNGLFYTARELDSYQFLKSKGKEGVVEVSKCGLGVFMIEIALLREIAAPHFEIRWLPEKKEHQGEDFYFISKLREHGVKIFVDQDISQNIGHAGEFVYTYGSYNEPSPNV